MSLAFMPGFIFWLGLTGIIRYCPALRHSVPEGTQILAGVNMLVHALLTDPKGIPGMLQLYRQFVEWALKSIKQVLKEVHELLERYKHGCSYASKTNGCIGAARPYGSLQSSSWDWAIRLSNQHYANLLAVEAVRSYPAQHNREGNGQ